MAAGRGVCHQPGSASEQPGRLLGLREAAEGLAAQRDVGQLGRLQRDGRCDANLQEAGGERGIGVLGRWLWSVDEHSGAAHPPGASRRCSKHPFPAQPTHAPSAASLLLLKPDWKPTHAWSAGSRRNCRAGRACVVFTSTPRLIGVHLVDVDARRRLVHGHSHRHSRPVGQLHQGLQRVGRRHPHVGVGQEAPAAARRADAGPGRVGQQARALEPLGWG